MLGWLSSRAAPSGWHRFGRLRAQRAGGGVPSFQLTAHHGQREDGLWPRLRITQQLGGLKHGDHELTTGKQRKALDTSNSLDMKASQGGTRYGCSADACRGARAAQSLAYATVAQPATNLNQNDEDQPCTRLRHRVCHIHHAESVATSNQRVMSLSSLTCTTAGVNSDNGAGGVSARHVRALNADVLWPRCDLK